MQKGTTICQNIRKEDLQQCSHEEQGTGMGWSDIIRKEGLQQYSHEERGIETKQTAIVGKEDLQQCPQEKWSTERDDQPSLGSKASRSEVLRQEDLSSTRGERSPRGQQVMLYRDDESSEETLGEEELPLSELLEDDRTRNADGLSKRIEVPSIDFADNSNQMQPVSETKIETSGQPTREPQTDIERCIIIRMEDEISTKELVSTSCPHYLEMDSSDTSTCAREKKSLKIVTWKHNWWLYKRCQVDTQAYYSREAEAAHYSQHPTAKETRDGKVKLSYDSEMIEEEMLLVDFEVKWCPSDEELADKPENELGECTLYQPESRRGTVNSICSDDDS